ncbi:TIGR03826 family flagellar region protein [Virgibacillus sp. SK37]|uniref:TIGR03826 family flagellar region protein n=1 Tax=Virgibacillus sp. SK37 TaxID=403957 RepID=UPI0004D0DFFF|nr:TIGR03826 family flagellar region protein [Virgibacillus sp. SK37]AIF44162.1 membrane protein [Virgibacillus sp. SK37]
MAELANCSRCDAVFVKNIRDICQACYKEEEQAFDTVYKFLRERKNREATMLEIVEATKVEEILITKFIKEKRLRTTDFPKLAYPCESCGVNIVTGKLCYDCSAELRKDLDKHNEEQRKIQEKEANKNTHTYYMFDKNK